MLSFPHVVFSFSGKEMYQRLTSDEKPFPLVVIGSSEIRKSKPIPVKQLRGRKTKMAPNNPADGLQNLKRKP